MELNILLFRGAVALALGLIVGLQRERVGESLAGIRTFSLLSLLGFVCGLVAMESTLWIMPAGLIVLAIVLMAGMSREKHDRFNSGITTEVAAVLIFLVSMYLAVGEQLELAVVIGGFTALLLHLKKPMHGFVKTLETFEVRAIMQFVLIAFVVYPLLPDKSYDAYEVLNPREIWLMVILITGISIASFGLQRLIGNRAGAVASGILGGLISSTATTATASRRSKSAPSDKLLVFVIIVASTVALLRVFVEVFLVAQRQASQILPPLLVFSAVMAVLSIVAYRLSSGSQAEHFTKRDPGQLKIAIVFGILYAVILYASAWAKDQFGNEGLYWIAVPAGFMDVDAIVISTAKLVGSDAVSTAIGWRVILVAILSNLLFKTGLAVIFGRGAVRRFTATYAAISILAGLGILWLWP